jgi:2-polyprenyl-3-methyl-5-hydroxy-6-metoxy-1,4-benzoquinol methylase
MNEMYKSYTQYKSYSEIKKLEFIVSTINKHYSKSQANKIKILEVGCGKGNISLPLASLGYQIYGIDLNPNEIDYVIKKNQFSNASFEIMDAERLKGEGTWDIVICSEIFEHLSSPKKLLIRLSEIIKSNGILIITIPNGYGPYELLFETPLRLIGRYNSYGHKQNYSFKNFSEFLNEFFSISIIKHSDFMSFWPIFKEVNLLAKIDCAIADILPHYLVSGWYFKCIPK